MRKRVISEKRRLELREQAKLNAAQETRIEAKLREIALRELGETDLSERRP